MRSREELRHLALREVAARTAPTPETDLVVDATLEALERAGELRVEGTLPPLPPAAQEVVDREKRGEL